MILQDSIPYYQAFDIRKVPHSLSDTIQNIEPELTQSIFDSSSKFQHYLTELPNLSNDNFQPFWILLFTLAFVAFIGNLMYRQYKTYLFDFFSFRLVSNNADKDERLGLLALLINLFFLLNISMFLMRIVELGNWIIPFTSHLQQYLIILGLIFSFWLAKYVVTIFIHTVFTNFKNGLELLKINQQVEFVLMIALIPANSLFYYSANTIDFGYYIIGLLAFIIIMGLIKVVINLKQISHLYTYQIFIYLCTLELLPILVILKFIL
jgi:hypothetical protein